MKKTPNILVFFILPTIISALILLNIFLPAKKYQGLATTNYQLGNKSYKLLVADTPQKWEKGLMNYRKLDGYSGMIFLFPDKNYRSFWNKNTYMDLDLYWIDDKAVVGKSKLPSIEKSKQIVTVTSSQPVNKVIELIQQWEGR